jgi:hypothetical protein
MTWDGSKGGKFGEGEGEYETMIFLGKRIGRARGT